MSDLITVIVPVYNVEKYIKRCVDSIVNQTYSNLEIILVDDGSTDESGAICDALAKTDDRIRVVHQVNQGLGPARNAGLRFMTGDFVAFVDSDDWLDLQTYEVLHKAIYDYRCDIATCGRLIVGDDGVISKVFCSDDGRILEGDDILHSFLVTEGMNMSACDKLFKSHLFESVRFPGDFLVSEDVVPVYTVLTMCERVYLTGQPFYNYYYRQGSLSKSSFSKRRIGAYTYSKEVAADVRERYPHLADEADFFEFDALTMLWRNMRDSHYEGEGSQEVFSDIKKNLPRIMKNKHLMKRHKVYALMSVVGVDRVANAAYMVVRSRRG